jgi:hypothetical protein
MKARFLFPHNLKRIGILIAIPSAFLGFLCLYKDFSIQFLTLRKPLFLALGNDNFLGDFDLTNELAIIGTILGLILISFSKEKYEDEYVSTLRLESLQWSMYLNFGFLVVFTLLVYGSNYYTVTVYNMFTPLIIFILRFNYLLYIKPKFTQEKYD